MFRNWYMAGTFLAVILVVNLGNAQALTALNDLPEAPAVQQAPASSPQPQQQPAATPATQPPQTTTPPQPAQSQSSQPQTSKPETSEDQLHQEEKQLILGVMATFNMTNNKDALPLTSRQKFQLFFKGATDSWTIGLTAFSAGIGQAEDSPPEWQGGVEGYAKRWGAGYADSFDGNLWGNAILTSWWHEDPRYYRKGSGSFTSRAWWAAGSSFWCKRDKGTWGPNYANVIGNLIGGGIANIYYPPSQRGLEPTLEHSATVTYYGILGAEVIEFWPDIANHYIKKHQEKKARLAARQQAQLSNP
ncbi:MAG: hypothetical protein WA634_01840 [Silvibacterium sp.]